MFVIIGDELGFRFLIDIPAGIHVETVCIVNRPAPCPGLIAFVADIWCVRACIDRLSSFVALGGITEHDIDIPCRGEADNRVDAPVTVI